ncbi:MAG: cell division protein FtsQ [Lachnospiraceae bacterium]|nr:cell division protein FtsQ [Lachnospiraceae bacterium]
MIFKRKGKKDRESFGEFLRQRRSFIIIILSLIVIVSLAWTGYRYIIDNYTVTRIFVDGNIQHSNQEIMDIVMEGRYGNNSLILSLRYKDKSIADIPFLEKIDVTVLERDTIRINVYEKAIAGCVEYLGRFLYFDKDGIIVETSVKRNQSIPEVVGLKFDYAIMYEKLPVRDMTIFTEILNIRHLLEQYNVPADKISFSERNEVTLQFGAIRVALGNEGYIDEKIMELEVILPKLSGKSGILRMEHYDEYSRETIFEPD